MNQALILACHTIKAIIRKKDFYVFMILLLALILFLMAQSFFGMEDISRFIKDVGYTSIWVFSLIIAVTFSAKQVPEEMKSRTVLPLLAKPVSRAQFLLGRFLGSFMASGMAFSMFFAVYAYVVSLRGEGIAPVLLAQSYVLGIAFMGMVCSVSLALSVFMTLSAAVTMSFIVYFGTTYFADMTRSSIASAGGIQSVLASVLYYIMPHYEFFDMRVRLAHSWEPLPLWLLSAVVVYAAAYSALMIALGYMKIRNEYL